MHSLSYGMREESIPLDEDAAAEGISTGKDTSSTSISIEEEPPNGMYRTSLR